MQVAIIFNNELFCQILGDFINKYIDDKIVITYFQDCHSFFNYQDEAFDVVFIDSLAPVDTCIHLLNKYPHGRVIAICRHHEPMYMEDARKKGFQRILPMEELSRDNLKELFIF